MMLDHSDLALSPLDELSRQTWDKFRALVELHLGEGVVVEGLCTPSVDGFGLLGLVGDACGVGPEVGVLDLAAVL